jgi:hypothetical protein
MGNTIVFLGAGATKSIGGPMTDEILPAIFKAQVPQTNDVKARVPKLVEFLKQEFHIDLLFPKEKYPGLPLLMSLIDIAIDRRELFANSWDVTQLAELREAIEIAIFDVLEDTLRRFPTNNHYTLLDRMFPVPERPAVISTNYDLVADTSMMFLSRNRGQPGVPNYYCGLANMSVVGPGERFGTLLKLHGSLNWLFCKTCQRLEVGATESTRFLGILNQIAKDLASSFTADGAPCSVCGTPLRPLLVAPSHLKDYRNPHLSQVWYEAQRVLRQADRVIFVGYSLPDDDVEVVYLLKRGLGHITNPKQITVVEFCKDNPLIARDEHPVGRRYRALFGDVNWTAAGLDVWLASPPVG